MKTKPILFNGAMVRAILRGDKTQTRRVVKPQPEILSDTECQIMGHRGPVDYLMREVLPNYGDCKYGKPGDGLWVRETWRCNGWATDVATIFYRASEKNSYTEMCEQFPVADKKRLPVTTTWKPSIHMPRWASRTILEIKSIRVERLRDISEEDAKAEGITRVPYPDGTPEAYGYMVGEDDGKAQLCRTAVRAFAKLWKSINGPDSWYQNPWVWVVEFAIQEPRD